MVMTKGVDYKLVLSPLKVSYH